MVELATLLEWRQSKKAKMPSTTVKQKRTMTAAAHNPKFA